MLETADLVTSALAGLLVAGTMATVGIIAPRTRRVVPGNYWMITSVAGLGAFFVVAIALTLSADLTFAIFLSGFLVLTGLIALEAYRTGQLQRQNARVWLILAGGIAAALIWFLGAR